MLSFFIALVVSFTSSIALADDWVTAGSDQEWSPLSSGGWQPMQDGWTALNTHIASRQTAPSDYRSILDIIGRAESPRLGYNAVVLSARIRPTKQPTQMTISEIYDWINATPGQNHAIGRYQFIPITLQRVVTKAGIRTSQRFTEAVQDRLAIVLIQEAGFDSWKAQRLSDASFMDNLAGIWAGFPLANGRSAHHGVGNNRATISRSAMQNALTNPVTATQPQTPANSKTESTTWERSDQW